MAFAALSLGLVALGCSDQKSGMNMADMKPPPRPAELDQLNFMVGQWQGTSEMTMEGQKDPIKGSGRNTVEWDCDRWCLVEHGEFEMGEGGQTMKGIGIWTYDPKSKKFKNTWVDSMGATMHGEATYNEGTRTFSMKAKGNNPMCGQTYGEGTIKMVNDRTMEWSWTEWMDSMKMNKMMSMKGTSTKM